MRTGNIRAAALCGASLAGLCLCSPISAQTRQFDVAAGDAGKSVVELARQAGIDVVAPGQQLQGITTPAIKGTYDAIAALELMLKGTDLVVSRSPDGTVTISPREPNRQEEREGMLKDSKNSVSLLALVFGALAAAPASAQDSGQAVETVTVTGFRASLATALDTKQKSNLLMESVAPEDIGKMPDKDVAESLQRLPGVQIDRAAGEGTQVRIRGLSYNITLLDGDVFVTGREMYTHGEGSGAGNGNLLQNSLEGIPSSLISGIDVFKSPNAKLVAGALGGTIDLRVRSALDGQEGVSVNGIAGMSYSQGAKKITPTASVVGQLKLSNNLGILAAVTYDEHDVRVFESQAQNRNGWVLAGPSTGVDNNLNPAANFGIINPQVDYFEPELHYLTNQTVDRKRFGTFLGVNYMPTDAIEVGVHWFHSHLTIGRADITNKVFIHSNGEAMGLDASEPFSIDPNGVVLAGTFASRSAEGSTMVEKDKNIGDNIQANIKYDNGGKFRASAKFAWGQGSMYSEFVQADFRQSGYSVNPVNAVVPGNRPGNNYANPGGCGGQGGNPNPLFCSFEYENRDGLHPVVSYLDTNLMTRGDTILFKSHWGWDVRSQNDQWSLRADTEYDVLDKVMLSTGLRFATSSVDYDFGRFLLNAYGDGTCSFDGSYSYGGTTHAAVLGEPCVNGQGQLSWEGDQDHRGPWTYYQDPGLPFVPVQTGATNPERLKLVKDFFPAAGIPNFIAHDPAPMLANPKAWLQSVNPDAPLERFKDAINSFTIDRKTYEGYFMIDVGEPVDGFHINSGVRVVHTVQDVGQYSTPPGVTVLTYNSTATWNGLPDISTMQFNVLRREYTDILPSLNAYWDVFEGHKLRFSAARVMAAANPWQLGAGLYLNYTRDTEGGHGCNINTSTPGAVPGDPGCQTDGFYFNSASSGNVNLDPYRANQMDLSWEYYFGDQGLAAVTLFWKGVDSFTQQSIVSTVFPDDFGGTAGGLTLVTNGRGGRIQGVEFNLQYAFENGFGFNANYTYAQSKTANFTDFDAHLGFPGVAQNAYTVQAYYETGPLAARVSYTWKGSALGSQYQTFAFASLCPVALVAGDCPTAIGTKTYGVYDRSYGQVDAQISYDIMENLGIVLEGRNLTGSSTSSYLQFKNLPFLYQQAGRSYAAQIKFQY